MPAKSHYTVRYALLGAVFGLLFPVGATVFDVLMQNLEFGFSSFLHVQKTQPLHWIIDTAPIFLGLFASFAGKRQDHVIAINEGLENEIDKRVKEIKENNEKLRQEISERKEIEAKLNEAVVQANQGAKAKEDFLVNMSHEIRTPMNAVIGMANLLKEQNPTEEQTESLELLLFSANNLLRIINDILDISKIEAGTVDINLQLTDVRDTVRKVVDELAGRIKEQNILYSTKIDSNIPEQLVTDAGKLIQVLENLLSNAIKFSPNGKVDITVSIESEDEDYIKLLFSITDTGIGISKENSDNIYDLFHQEDTGKSTNHSGTGLGLTIVRKLLHLLGSEIYHRERKLHGTEFFFYLSCKKSLKTERNVNTTLPSPDILKGRKVLLVEDNLMNQKVAMKFLNKWEIQCDLAENGKQALLQFNNSNYDLILMDLQMPEMDGFEATKEIRKTDQEIPIIALTAAALIEVKEKTEQVGMNDFITKPFQPSLLQEKLILHLSN